MSWAINLLQMTYENLTLHLLLECLTKGIEPTA